jgi:hypothetical protein
VLFQLPVTVALWKLRVLLRQFFQGCLCRHQLLVLPANTPEVHNESLSQMHVLLSSANKVPEDLLRVSRRGRPGSHCLLILLQKCHPLYSSSVTRYKNWLLASALTTFFQVVIEDNEAFRGASVFDVLRSGHFCSLSPELVLQVNQALFDPRSAKGL